MKTRKKLLLTSLSAILVGTLTTGAAMAFADTATKDHEFDTKNDVLFEDFDRADITDTVTASGGVDTGEKPYLHVEFDALSPETSAGDRVSQIYKQGSGSLGNITSSGSITITMRVPEVGLDISDLYFAVRGVGNNSDDAVVAKSFGDLVNSDNDSLADQPLTTNWQAYEISFTAGSYEDEDVFPNGGKVTETDIEGIHLYAKDGVSGTVEIQSITYNKGGTMGTLNNFLGGDDVSATATLSDSGFYWAGSSTGYIVKRAMKMSKDGNFTVTRSAPVGDYKYAVIEATGDVENLKVATTPDGKTWGTETAFDGYSVTLTGSETGFKFLYTGDGTVTVNRIYLTNLVTAKPAVAVPVIDASTADILEDFSVAQDTVTGDYDEMAALPQMEEAGLFYRISYSNADKVKVENGNLVFDATDLAADGYINYKFQAKTGHFGDYAVLKVKGENGADLSGFRFALGWVDSLEREGWGNVVWSHDMKAGVSFPAAVALDETNPYAAGDGWYYIVIDIAESGYGSSETGFSGMDIYYSGVGQLYIDNVFFADKMPNVEEDFSNEGVTFAGSNATWSYVGGMGLTNLYDSATSFSFDIIPADDNFDPSTLRLEFMGSGVYWASANNEGTLITTDGKMLTELTYTKGQATHVDIDLAASGIGAFSGIHVHVSEIGGFTLNNVALHTSTPPENFKNLSEDVITLENTFTASPTTDGYTYIGGADVPYGGYGKLEFTLTPGENFDGTEFRAQIKNGDTSIAEFWIAQYGDTVITADGKKYSEIEFTAGTPVTFVFDIDATINQFHVHSTGTQTGDFTVSGVKFTPYTDNYAEQIALFSRYLDTVKPTVSITTATTATAGDEITVAYTASDDVTAAEDLVVTVSVVKDGSAVTLNDNKFTAEAGTYTVTVTVKDANGNEASDTIQITVAAATPDPVTPESGCGAGCSSTSLLGGALGGLIALGMVAAMLAVVHIIRKKKEN